MDGSDCYELLPKEDKRNGMIQAISDYLQTDITQGKGIYYDGVVIDFEGLRNTKADGTPLLYDGKQISEYYSLFLSELKAQLTSIGKKLYVAVNPGLYYDGYDYTAIIDTADRVILMAHDYEPTERLQKNQVQQYTGYDALEPLNSMAPIQLVRQALMEMKIAASEDAKLAKVWLQITFDSAQWQFDVNDADGWDTLDGAALSREGRSTPLYKSIKARADNADGKGKAITYGYNNELQTPYIQYYNTSDQSFNVILYEDSNSIRAKIELAKSYGLGGISVWSLANVPDYNDAKGKKFYLDGWTTLLEQMSSFDEKTETTKYISFSEYAFEQAVREKLGQPTGKIAASDLQDIYRLKLPKGVKSIKDLKYLPNLEYLDAGQLGIRDITSLSSLTGLRVLYLPRNSISDISVLKKLTKLEVLSLNGNQISSIASLSSLTKLQELYLRENKVTDITPLGRLTKLETLEIGMNSIKKIDELKKLKVLRILALDNNKITDLQPLKMLTGLESLYIQRNQISDIASLSAMKELRLLSLNGNKINNLKPLAKLTKLEKLYLKDNKITNITSLKGLLNLKELYLGGNQITDYTPVSKLLLSVEFTSDFR
jgi:internalin A